MLVDWDEEEGSSEGGRIISEASCASSSSSSMCDLLSDDSILAPFDLSSFVRFESGLRASVRSYSFVIMSV